MRKRSLMIAVALGAALAAMMVAAAPAGAAGDFKLDGVGAIKILGECVGGDVCINTSAPTGGSAVWFGLRVFTVAPGTMISHTGLKTSDAAYRYGTAVAAPFPCISDFAGNGASNGSGLPGAGNLDPGIAMVGGFAGPSTGCTSDGTTSGSKIIKFDFNTTGAPSFAFYGAFYGTEAATWRGQVGTTTGNAQWWNLWGNFTSLAYSTDQ